MEYFEDYYDEEGNLHIDSRKPTSKLKSTKNFRINKEDLVGKQEKSGKLIIHNCNLVD